MAQVIPFTSKTNNPSEVLRGAREQSGLSHADFTAQLGRAIGRPELSPGTIRAWERNTVSPPTEVLQAAQRLARRDPPAAEQQMDGRPVSASLVSTASPASGAGGTGAEIVMQSFRHTDRRVGGAHMYGTVLRYLETEIAPLLFRGTADLFCAAAGLTEMAGWMAHDAGHDALAHQHFDRALRFASATVDIELAAHVHASLSHLAQQLDRPRDGLRLARAGRAILRRRDHHPALSARLHAMEARALATLRRRADCARALMAAERALDRAHSGAPSPWVSPFDRASLAAEASLCMQQLQQLAAARLHSEQVLSLRTSSHTRSRAFGQLRLVAILVCQGEIEYACTVSQSALTSSDRLSSNRVTQLVHSLHAQLIPHSTILGVEDVLDALSTALATRGQARPLIAETGKSLP